MWHILFWQFLELGNLFLDDRAYQEQLHRSQFNTENHLSIRESSASSSVSVWYRHLIPAKIHCWGTQYSQVVHASSQQSTVRPSSKDPSMPGSLENGTRCPFRPASTPTRGRTMFPRRCRYPMNSRRSSAHSFRHSQRRKSALLTNCIPILHSTHPPLTLRRGTSLWDRNINASRQRTDTTPTHALPGRPQP